MTNISSPIIKSLLQSVSTEPADGRDGSRRVNSGEGEAGEGERGGAGHRVMRLHPINLPPKPQPGNSHNESWFSFETWAGLQSPAAHTGAS